ncbi:MAG: hypothetical protein FDZ75_04425 [Actinobacteria bacterium]|nr:MAG: hypothetical protein FDZ75_04425 [Actinomycetota bacterium]
MGKVLAIAGAVVRDAIRRKIVWVVFIFAVLLSFVAPALPSYGAGVVEAVFREVTIALMFAAAFVVTLTVSAGRISAEAERRTVYNILGHDVRRWQYVTATWLGTFAVEGVVVGLLCATSMTVAAVVCTTSSCGGWSRPASRSGSRWVSSARSPSSPRLVWVS